MPGFQLQTALPERPVRILDMMDPPDMSTSAAGGNNTVLFRRGGIAVQGGGTSLAGVLESVGGVVVSTFQGGLWCSSVSAAAQRKTRSGSRIFFPFSIDIAQRPASSRQPLLYQLESLIQRDTPLVALAPYSFSSANTAGTVSELSDTAAAGYELVSRSDVNAGRWTVRVRLVQAGALTVVQDTGINPATTPIIHACMRLQSTTNPRLSFLINGQEFGVLQGVANMPLANGSLQTTGLVQGLSVGGGVGQVDRSVQARWFIEELPGFV